MACGCKDDLNGSEEYYEDLNMTQKIIKFVFSVILYLILLPFVMVATVIMTTYLLFKFLILQETDLDITDGLMKVGKVLKRAGENDDEESYEFENGQEYEIIGVEEIKPELN